MTSVVVVGVLNVGVLGDADSLSHVCHDVAQPVADRLYRDRKN